jgi:hypothetical protein
MIGLITKKGYSVSSLFLCPTNSIFWLILSLLV